jgi:hypothetical protein
LASSFPNEKHAEHCRAGAGVAAAPGFHVRQRAQRVDAGEVPELDQHRADAQQIVDRLGFEVDPGCILRQVGNDDVLIGDAHGEGGYR